MTSETGASTAIHEVASARIVAFAEDFRGFENPEHLREYSFLVWLCRELLPTLVASRLRTADLIEQALSKPFQSKQLETLLRETVALLRSNNGSRFATLSTSAPAKSQWEDRR